MDTSTFNAFRELVYAKSGISLGEGKEALVSSRVSKRLRALGIESYREYMDVLQTESEEMTHFLDVISTNVTSFFREPKHFDALTKWIGEWKREGRSQFRCWCAASSTGEEPYTLALVFAEVLGLNADFRILATDISSRVLETAKQGQYSETRMAQVPREYRHKYFSSSGRREGSVWTVQPALREHIVFSRLNLAEPPFPMKGPFDVVFCRNVMIYFDNPVRERLLAEAYRLLRPHGFLVVGHTESLTGVNNRFKHVQPSIFTRD